MKIIYKIRYGSHAYGTNTPHSDLDIRGIYLPSIDECLSLNELPDFYDREKDILIFPLQKFFRLLSRSNPSVIEWLYVDEKDILEMTHPGQRIRENRELFLSKEIYDRFKGYALSEFGRLEKLTGDTGEKRKQGILQYGYNVKSAGNVLRLLQEATELLSSSFLTLPLKNREQLLEIKNGGWSYRQVEESFQRRMEELQESYAGSRLPEHCDLEAIDKLMIEIIKNG